MATGKTRIVHYISHFFAGVGGEEKADTPLELRDGPLGPGRGLEAALKGKGEIVATLFCGDNYVSEHQAEVLDRITELVRSSKAEVLIAGPAFNAGRYGYACVEICNSVANSLGIPCVTAMWKENPGVQIYQKFKNWKTLCLPTTEIATGMNEVLPKMASFALRLAAGDKIGPAKEEGYVPRGIRLTDYNFEKTGAERAVEMLKAKMAGKPFDTELPIVPFEYVPPAPPLADLKKAHIVLVSTAGVVPKGNPDRFRSTNNVIWAKYSIRGLRSIDPEKWVTVHGGYNTAFMNVNPHLGVPLDVLRQMEDAGEFGSLHDDYYVTPGVQVQVGESIRMGKEMVADVKKSSQKVDACLLVST